MPASLPASSRAGLLDHLRERLETVARLEGEMRAALQAADAATIHEATGRLETVLLEFRVLHGELERLPRTDDDAYAAALARFEEATLRLARASAVGGGLLARLIAMSRALIGAVTAAGNDAYGPSGRGGELGGQGLRLTETA